MYFLKKGQGDTESLSEIRPKYKLIYSAGVSKKAKDLIARTLGYVTYILHQKLPL